MIVPGILSSQKEPIKTTLLLAMNFGTNPNMISGVGTHVDMSGRGHVFQQHGYFGVYHDVIHTITFDPYYSGRPDYDGRALPVYNLRKLWYVTPSDPDSGPTILQIMDHVEDVSGTRFNSEEEMAKATYLSSFPRIPRVFDFSTYTDLAATVKFTNHDADFYDPTMNEGAGGTNHDGDLAYHFDAVDYWDTVDEPIEPFYLYEELKQIQRGHSYLISEAHPDFDWSDNDTNFRLSFEIKPLYNEKYQTEADVVYATGLYSGTKDSSGLIISNGSFLNKFKVSYVSSGDLIGGSGPVTSAELRIQFGSNLLTIKEEDLYPPRYLRNGYVTKVRIDRINGIAYIYINDIFAGSMIATGIASTFDLRVDQIIHTPPVPVEHKIYINDEDVTTDYIGRPSVGPESLLESYNVNYPVPCNRLVIFGQEQGFGGDIQNLHLFSIDN